MSCLLVTSAVAENLKVIFFEVKKISVVFHACLKVHCLFWNLYPRWLPPPFSFLEGGKMFSRSRKYCSQPGCFPIRCCVGGCERVAHMVRRLLHRTVFVEEKRRRYIERRPWRNKSPRGAYSLFHPISLAGTSDCVSMMAATEWLGGSSIYFIIMHNWALVIRDWPCCKHWSGLNNTAHLVTDLNCSHLFSVFFKFQHLLVFAKLVIKITLVGATGPMQNQCISNPSVSSLWLEHERIS